MKQNNKDKMNYPLIIFFALFSTYLLSCKKASKIEGGKIYLEKSTPIKDEKTGLIIADKEILIHTKDRKKLEEKIRKIGGEIVGEIPQLNIYQIKVQLNPTELRQKVMELTKDKEFASLNFFLSPQTFPQDPLFDSWDNIPAGNNWGFEFLNLPKAWDIFQGDINPPIAIIDWDFEKHPDLNLNLIDEGGNINHGTPVAGIIGAVANNGKGIAGVMWRSNVLAMRFDGSMAELIAKIVQSLEGGAKVINFSGGLKWGRVPTDEDEEVLYYHRQIFSVVFQYVKYYDALFIQSAGNEGIDAKWAGVAASVKDIFPDNIIIVGGLDEKGGIWPLSNTGEIVDIFAPAVNIFTTCIGGTYCTKTGTSLATAFISGIAGLVRSMRPDLTAKDCKKSIMKSIETRRLITYSVTPAPDAYIILLTAKELTPSERETPGELPQIPPISEKGILEPKAAECATYDPTLKAPLCPPNSEACSTCYIIDGRDDLAEGPETNQPNTLHGECLDGTKADRNALAMRNIVVESLSETGFFITNTRVKATFLVFCSDNRDYINEYYYPAGGTFTDVDASFIWDCPGGTGNRWAKIEFVLASTAGQHLLRYSTIHNATPPICPGSGAVGEADDIIFPVLSAPPPEFSCASYNTSFKTPVCPIDSGWCGTCTLVRCRDGVGTADENIPGLTSCTGGEPNTPNTIFNQCSDGTSNSAAKDEEVRSINVKTLSTSGRFDGGELVEISFLAYCWSTDDKFNIYYASGVNSSLSTVNWKYISSIDCPGSGLQRLRYTLRLDNVEGYHVVRVAEYCNTTGPISTGICPSGNCSVGYEDRDDIVFYVKSQPPSSLPVCAIFDDTTADGDPAYFAPKCPGGVRECSTCNAVSGRDNMAGGVEPGDQNNTIDTCLDEGSGTYLTDENVERIEIRSFDPSGTFQPGSTAEVTVLVYCWPGGFAGDNLKLLYTSNADSPSWQSILTSPCQGPGWQSFKKVITLGGTAGRHAIRASFKYGLFSGAEICGTSDGTVGGAGYADNDDLVFYVGVPLAPENFTALGVSPDSITLSWNDVQGETRYEIRVTDVWSGNPSAWSALDLGVPADRTWYVHKLLPEGSERCYALRACNLNGCSSWVTSCGQVPLVGGNCAQYNPNWRVPECPARAPYCSTCDLVKSRDTIQGRAEVNTPNSFLNSCPDGTGGEYFKQRSIEKIEISEPGGFIPNATATVTATVFCDTAGSEIRFYHSLTSPVSFTLLGTATCSGTNQVELKTINFPLGPTEDWRILRVAFAGAGTCPTSAGDEVDDIAFVVGGVPSIPTGFQVGFYAPDSVTVSWNDTPNETYYMLATATSEQGPWTKDSHDPIAQDTTYHIHGPFPADSKICYTLWACNSLGCSGWTSPLCTIINLRPPLWDTVPLQPQSPTSIKVSFVDNSTQEDEFYLECTTNGTWTDCPRVSITSSTKSTTGTVYSYTYTVREDVSYCFRVKSRVIPSIFSDFPSPPTQCEGSFCFLASGEGKISAGIGQTTCAVKIDGSLWCWGANDYGQVGNGGVVTPQPTPVQVMASGASQVSVGGFHTCTVKTDGSLWCWGANYYGQVGDGTTTQRETPQQIMSSGVSHVSAGAYHTCAVKWDNTLWCWGYNRFGQVLGGLDLSVTQPTFVMSGVRQVSAGGNFTCAVKTDDSLWCWGYNGYGQVGNGTSGNTITQPASITSGVYEVSTGVNHTCAVKTDNSVQCWGDNSFGQVGDGTTTQRNSPVQVMGADVSRTKVRAGQDHTCAIRNNNVFCWGGGSRYQNKDPGGADVLTPQLVSYASDIAVGGWYTCIVKVRGGMRCWGDNVQGELGTGSTFANGTADEQCSLKLSPPLPPFYNGEKFYSYKGEKFYREEIRYGCSSVPIHLLFVLLFLYQRKWKNKK